MLVATGFGQTGVQLAVGDALRRQRGFPNRSGQPSAQQIGGQQAEHDGGDGGPYEEAKRGAEASRDLASHDDHIQASVRSRRWGGRVGEFAAVVADCFARRQSIGLQLIDRQTVRKFVGGQGAIGPGDQHRDLVDRENRAQRTEDAQPTAQLSSGLLRSRRGIDLEHLVDIGSDLGCLIA